MTLTAPKGKTFDPVPAGSHIARLYQIIHIGTVKTEWQGKTSQTDKVRLTFELCNERKAFKEGDEPKPYSISREFSFYMGRKTKLREFTEGMIGTSLDEEEASGFNFEDLLGSECLLNVVHNVSKTNGNTYADIKSASPLPKGMKAPEIYNEPRLIDINTASKDDIDALPEFIADKMKSSDEYDRRFRQDIVKESGTAEEDIADAIPF